MTQVQLKSFTSPRTPAEAPLVEQLNQFFAGNPEMTLLSVQTSSKEGSARGRQMIVTLAFDTGANTGDESTGGVTYSAVEFINTASQPVESQANAFFAAHPGFLPVRSLILQSKEPRFLSHMRLMVFYQTTEFFSGAHDTLKLTGSAEQTIQPGSSDIVPDSTDVARARFPLVLNMSIRPWLRSGTAMVVKSVDGSGDAAFAGVGPNLFTVGAPLVLPAAPTPPAAAPACPCCFRLISANMAYGSAVCELDPQLAWDIGTCRRGVLTDIIKAAGTGYVTVGGPGGPGSCYCNAADQKWMWIDPAHFLYAVQTTYDGGFFATVGFQELDPLCAGPSFTDALWVLQFERCSSSASAACTTAPVDPPPPIVEPPPPVIYPPPWPPPPPPPPVFPPPPPPPVIPPVIPPPIYPPPPPVVPPVVPPIYPPPPIWPPPPPPPPPVYPPTYPPDVPPDDPPPYPGPWPPPPPPPPYPPVDPPPVIPPIYPPTTGQCSYTYTATCVSGVWSLTSTVANGCVEGCVSDSDWVGAGCTRTYTLCGDDCYPDPP